MKKIFLNLFFFLILLLNSVIAQPPPPPGNPSTFGGTNAPVGTDIGDAALFLIALSMLYGIYYVIKYIKANQISKNPGMLKQL